MKFSVVLLSIVLIGPCWAARSGAAVGSDWPGWRGPAGDGHAAAGQKVPVKWNENENVLWRTAVRGRGHGSPTVLKDRIYLATADVESQKQLVLCFDRKTGKQVWEAVVHRGKLETKGHRNASQASSTVATDGERLYINFLNDKAVHTTALDLAGKILWQRKVDDFVTHQGFGSSPILYQSIVLVSADHRGGGKVKGLDKRTGDVVWQQERPKIANYTSPAVVHAAGKAQVVLSGCNLASSYDPLSGRKLWEIESSTEETVTSVVSDGERVFMTGGYPKNHVVAIEADGSGRIAWQNGSRVYVPSMLVRDGHLYAILDAGLAVCWKSDTGDELWREKIDKDFFPSPVMVGERIYATSLGGVTSVFEATPTKFKLLSQNALGNEALATPAICGNRIYLRHAKKGDVRQEFLWCVGE